MEELSQVEVPYPEADAKNLFVRDDKKRNYYLITVQGDKRVNLKEFRRNNGTRPLSFASEEELKERMDLLPGAVTPLGILNDEARSVQFFLDKAFLGKPGLVGVHPNENTATTRNTGGTRFYMPTENFFDRFALRRTLSAFLLNVKSGT